jgi:arylformamidase
LGAHADAPGHYFKEGNDISHVDLFTYIGPCEVMTATVSPGTLVGVQHFDPLKIANFETKRFIIRTNSFPNPDEWNSDFCALDPDFVEFLHAKGVKLVGIDTPSVDFESSKELKSHAVFARTGMAILEGIDLRGVKDGTYELIALPLRLAGADASPVRAILRRPNR